MESLLKNIENNDEVTNKRVIEIVITTLGRDATLQFLGDLCDVIHEKKLSSEMIEAVLEPFDEDEDLVTVLLQIMRWFEYSRRKITQFFGVDLWCENSNCV